jgi:large subunit ribosomal protein L25
MEKVVIEAQKRVKIDKASRSALRKEGKVPAIFYSKHHEPMPVQFSERSIHPYVFTAKTSLITLNVEGHEELDCIIKDVQFDPVSEKIVHIDLLGLKKGEKIQIEVPVQLVGNAIGIKEGGILQHTLHKVQIECLPVDIPEHLEIDVTDLKLGHAIHAGDLKFDNFILLNSPEAIIAAVTHPKIEKEETPAAGETPEAVEPEVISKGKPQDKEE